jgi:hypothetical protein
MLCDACLMLLYTSFKANETARKVFFALQVDDFPTIEVLMKESGVSRHGVREALSCFRGAGLVWGNGCAGLSDDGYRLMELLCDPDQPEPSEVLCDDCLLEVGQGLSSDEYAVLAQLSDRATHSRHALIVSTEISVARLRDVLLTLKGARLIQSARGRSFRLSETGRRLERLLRRRQGTSQWDAAGAGRSPVARESLSLRAVTGERGL